MAKPAKSIPHHPHRASERLSPEERQRMIAEAAYYRALNRGFHGGDPIEDWVSAEREIGAIDTDRTSAERD